MQGLFLGHNIAGYAQNPTHCVSDRMNRSWRPHGLGFLRHDGDKYGRNSFCFNLSLHRNDYPVAERSTACENHPICMGPFDLMRNRRREVLVLALEIC